MYKIAYVGLRYNYAKPEEGDSFEYNHLEQGLLDCQNAGLLTFDAFHPDVDGEIDQLDSSLSDYDGIFHAEFNEEYDLPENIAKQALKNNKFVIVWSSDASWRFHNWILPRKQRYSHFITTHSQTVPWYHENDMRVIKSQWFATSQYSMSDKSNKLYDVVFLGQAYGIRRNIITELSKRFGVAVAGNYWKDVNCSRGYITSFQESLDFMYSGIVNLNLSMPFHGGLPQIKGRLFQPTALGECMITTPADNTEDYFKNNEEIVICTSFEDIIDKLAYFVEDFNGQKTAKKIGKAAFDRVQKEHLAIHRIPQILGEL